MDKLMMVIVILAWIGAVSFTFIWAMKVYFTYTYDGSLQQMLDVAVHGTTRYFPNKGLHLAMAIICIVILIVYYRG